jgi:acetyltransferase-like isoleucine patch superfamily enzyme
VLEREIFANICEGQGGYKLEGKTFDATGVYKILKKLNSNCDSLLTLNLYVNPLRRRNQDVFLCEGQRFDFKGKSYNKTGVYQQIIKNAEACDSVFIFNVKVTPLTRITRNFRICAGEKIKVGDSTYSKSGTYVYTFKRAVLCDSVVTSILIVEDAFTISINPDIIIEKGDSVLLQTTLRPAANYTFDWSPTLGLSCTTCPNTWAKPLLTTTYTVNAVIANGKCFNKAKTQISVSCGLYMPDVFSPNNDGINDIFRVAGSRCVTIK